MDKSELKLSYDYFHNAVMRFKEALREDIKVNSLFLDGAIRRFEFSYEMCWKTLKRFLEHEGVRAKTPRDVFKEAFRLGYLQDGDTFWSQMIEDRNLTSHTYDQKIALALYQRLNLYSTAFETTLKKLHSKLS